MQQTALTNTSSANTSSVAGAHSDHPNGLVTLLAPQWDLQSAMPTDLYGRGVEALVRGTIDSLT
ncbi:MAG: hypothetical protein WBG13_29625, partial [Pseudolabrys sp.]